MPRTGVTKKTDRGLSDRIFSSRQLTDLQICLEKKFYIVDRSDWTVDRELSTHGLEFFGELTHECGDPSWKKFDVVYWSDWTAYCGVTEQNFLMTQRMTHGTKLFGDLTYGFADPFWKKWCRGPDWLNGGKRTRWLKFFDDPTHGFTDVSLIKSFM